MAPLSPRAAAARPFVPAGWMLGVGLLALFLFARFHDAFDIPFLNDDYVFLDHVSRKGFTDLWGFRDLVFRWWRPWSREFHYWWLERAFGPNETPFHVASLVLSGAVLAAYWKLARRLAGASAAAVAVAGVATLPGWGLMLLWPAGAQDLWMLLLSLLALVAWRSSRAVLAAALYALALASKETAALLPLLFVAHEHWVARRPWQEWSPRLLPALGVGLAWVAAHPLLLGRLWAGAPVPLPPSPAALPAGNVILHSALSALSLDRWPLPDGGWRSVGWDALRGALLLIVFLGLLARRDPRLPDRLGASREPRLGGVLPLAAVWWGCGTLPLLVPGLGWHAYYAHFAALGAWLGLGRLLAHQRALSLALVALLAVLGAGRAATPSPDWGEAAYARRAGAFVTGIRRALFAAYPKMEPHARLWFVRLPNNIGFLAGDGPAVRVWYRDPTLKAGYYSAYRPRATGEAQGPDRFFRVDETGQFVEVKRTAGDDSSAVATAARENPRWGTDHLALASALAAGKDWPAAAAEFRALASAYPESSGYAFDAATSFMQAGDSAAALEWFREAARRPGAPPELVEAARAIVPAAPGIDPARRAPSTRRGEGKRRERRTQEAAKAGAGETESR